MGKVILYFVYMALITRIISLIYPLRSQKQKSIYIGIISFIVLLFITIIVQLQFDLIAGLCMYLIIFFLFNIPLADNFLFSLTFIFHYVLAKNIVIGCYTLSSEDGSALTNIRIDPFVILLCTYALTILMCFLFHKFFDARQWKLLIKRRICVYSLSLLMLIIDILLCISLYSIGNIYSLISIPYLILSLLCVSLILKSLFHRFYNQDNIVEITLLKKQLANQLQLYEIQSEYIKEFRKIKHDVSNQLKGLGYLLQEKEFEKALSYTEDLEFELAQTNHIYQKFSNHVMVDAILQDINISCKEHKIVFEGLVNINRNPLTDLQLCTIFSNLLKNAFEANLKVKKVETRFIEVKSHLQNGWFLIHIRNRFDGYVRMKNGSYETMKDNKMDHGIGLKSVKEILDLQGGVLSMETQEEHIFHTTLLVPIHTIDDESERGN